MSEKENTEKKEPPCPLIFLNEGEIGEIVEFRKPAHISNPSHAEMYFRLDEMGLRTGKAIQMLNNSNTNTILIKIDNSRLALPRKIATKIYVRKS